jgi:hypothetical protein
VYPACVADESRAPAPAPAIRITRPYASEEDYLKGEIETLTRTSITLLGAQQRPQGVVLRFEVVLSTGQALVRGEGRVVGYKPNALHGLGGLTLRFTRLDSRSKDLVDRAAAIREKRRSSAPPAGGEMPAAPRSTPPPPGATSLAPPLPPAPSAPHFVQDAAEGRIAPPPPRTTPKRAEEPARSPTAANRAGAVPAPPDRDALLERLRSRAKALDVATVRDILDRRRRA